MSHSFGIETDASEDTRPPEPGPSGGVANSSMMRHRATHKETDVNKLISALEHALQLTPNKPARLDELGTLLHDRFERLGNVDDIDNAIATRGDAVRLTPDRHPNKPARLSKLGISLLYRCERLGNLDDINRAIKVNDEAMRLTPNGHWDKPAWMSNLGISLQHRFERTGNMGDIDEAIAVHEVAVRLTRPSHVDMHGRLGNLRNSLMLRFARLGNMVDIDKAIMTHDDAVRLVPDGHADKPHHLSDLSASLKTRFERFGNLADIDRAVAAADDAVRLTPDGHPRKPAYLSNLGTSLQSRFQRLGNVVDIERAIAAHENAVRLSPESHADMPGLLTNLGISFELRFERLGAVVDIDKAVAAYEGAVRLTPSGHAAEAGRLNNLGNSFVGRFERLGNTVDIDRAIAAHDDAVRLTPEGHADKPGRLSNLGVSLQQRCRRLRNMADIDKAIAAQESAVHLSPDSYATKPGYHINLGKSLLQRYRHGQNVTDLNAAIFQLSCAARCPTGPPALRFRAAVHWSDLNHIAGNSSLDAYSCALDLLPRVAWLGLPMADRHKELTQIGNVVRDAAAAAIESGHYEMALEWLEQGRSIVWGQLLHLRSPVDGLRTKDPALVERLQQISKDLERASIRDSTTDPDNQISMEEAARHHRKLALDWDELVERARTIPGFEDFLRPKRLRHLRGAARSGPVVVINIHNRRRRHRCDALILRGDLENVIHVPLDFSYDQAQKLQCSLDSLLSAVGLRARTERHLIKANVHSDERKFKTILSELWLHIAKPVLESLAFPVSRTDDPPRIWWCPTGPLTFLPLHAAGHYDTNELGLRVADFVVSSYTPTLTALLENPRATKPNDHLLIVTQPSTPGQSSLPNTVEELSRIRTHASKLSVTTLRGAEATVEHVLKGMKGCGWIHLACHGTQDTVDPTQSALLLQDGRLNLSEIIKTPLPHAEFAFLSACQTAAGDRRLSEEAVHLAAGMLLAGYRSVVATTWSIKDNDAPLVADEVYARLFKDGSADPTRAAHALHHAVQRLRESKGVSLFSWVPFIHVGM